MSRDNVEIVRAAFAANRSGPPEATVDAAVALSGPDCELTSRISSVEGESYRGHEGIRQYFADMADAFEEWTNEVHSVEMLREDAVLSDSTFRAVGRSGVGVELRSVALWLLADDAVTGFHAFATREDALEAAERR